MGKFYCQIERDGQIERSRSQIKNERRKEESFEKERIKEIERAGMFKRI